MRRATTITCTTLVLEALRAADDFLSRAMLMSATSLSANQVDAATHHLYNHRAIDCVVNPDGRAWWFPLPPESDDRSRHVDERALETAPRRRRKKVVVDS